MKKLLLFTVFGTLLVGVANAAPTQPKHRSSTLPPAVAPKIEPQKPIFSFQGEDTDSAIEIKDSQNCTTSDGSIKCTYYGFHDNSSQVRVAGKGMNFIIKSYNSETKKLYHVYASMGKYAYPDVLAAFVEKYGNPATSEVRKWQSKAGAVFDNAVTVWHFKGGDLEIDSLGLDLDSASFEFNSKLNEPSGSKPKIDF